MMFIVWRYLLYKYDHEQAFRCFSNLIRCLFSLNDALVEAIQSKQYIDTINSIVKRIEETLTLSDDVFFLLFYSQSLCLFLNKKKRYT
jgi:hypothetical protein